MALKLYTHIALPPGVLERSVLETLVRCIFEEYKWLAPVQFLLGPKDCGPSVDDLGVEVLLKELRRLGSFMIADETEQKGWMSVDVAREKEYPYTGSVVWLTPAGKANKAAWCRAHAEQVDELMGLLNSPLAHASLWSDYRSKTDYLVEEEVGQSMELTLRDYSEGLKGLFWRNFLGEPFIRLFGERLSALPPETVTRLPSGRVLVQPYERPQEAGTEVARERERHLIQLLGPECFYNHETHQKPTRRPQLSTP